MSLEGTFSGFSESFDKQPNGTGRGLGVAAAADLYATRWLAFTASVGFTNEAVRFGSSLPLDVDELPVEAGFGLRFGDARFDLAYLPTFKLAGEAPTGSWGTIRVSSEVVFARTVQLTLDGSIFHGGGAIQGEVAWFVTKNVGLVVGGLGSSGAYIATPVLGAPIPREDEYEVRPGVSVWVTSHLRLEAEYELTGRADHGAQVAPMNVLDNAGALQATARAFERSGRLRSISDARVD